MPGEAVRCRRRRAAFAFHRRCFQQLAIERPLLFLIAGLRMRPAGCARSRGSRRWARRLAAIAWCGGLTSRRRLGKVVAARRHPVFRDRRAHRLSFVFFCQRGVKLLLEHAQYALIDKVMHQTRLVETNFMLRRVDVDIHLVRIDLQIKHKCRLLVGPQLIFAGLTNRMID